MHAHT
ncbi:hypothetical protein NP493_1144g00029 [Ridgeia piscesae]